MRLFTASIIIYGLKLHWAFYVLMLAVWSAPYIYRWISRWFSSEIAMIEEDRQRLGIGPGFPKHSPAKALDESFEIHLRNAQKRVA